MKRAPKIALVSLLSFFGLIIITISILLWFVFTPARLTPIVRDQLKNYVNCKTELGEVELTFFSTFPQFGFKISNLTLINPIQGAPSDTLLSAKTVYATFDVKAYLDKNQVLLNDIQLEDINATAYINQEGKTNYDVFITDTTSTDTSAFVNPFDLIALKKLSLKNAFVQYVDDQAKMKAILQPVDAELGFEFRKNIFEAQLLASSNDISFRMDTTDYLKNATAKLVVPFSYDLDNKKLNLNASDITVNNLPLQLKGTVQTFKNNNDIALNLDFESDEYSLKGLLKFVPKMYLTSLEGIEMDGKVSSRGIVRGIYNDTQMPLIDLNATMNDGNFSYAGFDYKLYDLAGNADVKLDMNEQQNSKVILNSFKAKTGKSEIEGKGLVDYILMDDMLIDLDLQLLLQLNELNPLLPQDLKMKLSGLAKGNSKVKFMLSDATNMNIEKMNIAGKLNASDLGIQYDTISMFSEKAILDLKMPNNPDSYRGNNVTSFLNADVWCNKLKVLMGKNTSATLLNVNLLTQTTNLMQTNKTNTMVFDFNFDQMTAAMDNMTVAMEKSKGQAGLKMNFDDSDALPVVDCDFDVSSLTYNMDTISAHLSYPKGSVAMRADKLNPSKIIYDLKLQTATARAQMGKNKFDTGVTDMFVNIIYDDKESNTMLQWQPKGHILMNNANINADGVKATIQLPNVELDFTPDEYTIHKAKMLIDNSDFELVGKLWNVENYLKDKGILMGEFNFNSNVTDVYRIMDLTNGFGEQDTTNITEDKTGTVAAAQASSSGPYMVPKGVDITLNAHVKKAMYGFDSAQNVLGKLYIKDGLMVLEDMRFITSAAKMQLTALYKTPRKNHLFIGLDYHMVDIEIASLLKMIPDIDTIMPMLRSFGGRGDFHIAVETYTDSAYNLKKSTLRGVSSVKGENLVLMDGETFSEIAKTLMFSKKTQNKVDSLSAEFTIFRNEVDVYPFQIVMDKYKAVVAGRHNLDMSFDYHISLTDSPLPVQLGVDIKGTLDDMKIRPAKCRYAKLYRPAARKEIDTKQLEIRKMIRDALTSRVIKQ